MTLRTHAAPNYVINRREAIFGAEGIRRYAYVDTNGIGTIAYGLNLQTHGWLVLDALGFDVRENQLTGAALTAERGYLNRISTLFQQSFPSDNTANNLLLAQLNTILAQRAADAAYASFPTFSRIQTFEFATDAAAAQLTESVFDNSYLFRASPPQGRPLPISFPGYEAQLDSKLPTGSALAAPVARASSVRGCRRRWRPAARIGQKPGSRFATAAMRRETRTKI